MAGMPTDQESVERLADKVLDFRTNPPVSVLERVLMACEMHGVEDKAQRLRDAIARMKS